MAIRIFIDQGHNPSGPNTAHNSNHNIRKKHSEYASQLKEKHNVKFTYTVGLYLAELLSADPRFEVRLSRTSPDEILGTSNATSLAARVQAANDWPADYFISIHCNANENPAVNGTEVYVYRENTQAYWLAQHVLNGIVQRTGTRNNGVRVRPGLYVLRRTKMPAILVELAYLTNAQDALRLETDPFGFAQGIMNGILEYFA